MDDQSTLPSSYRSFIAYGRYDEPPAGKSRVRLDLKVIRAETLETGVDALKILHADSMAVCHTPA